jgi:drug/metabolite transporter (DMT)-like permease
MKKTSSIFLLLGLAACWSCFALFTKIGASATSPIMVGFCRCFFAIIPLFLFCAIKRKNFFILKNFKHYAIIGTCNSAIPFSLYGLASRSLDSGVITILDGAILVFEVLITAFILKKPVEKTAIFGTFLGISGIILTSLSMTSGFNFSVGYLSAVLMILAATCLYAACSIYISNKCKAIDPIVLALGSVLFSSILLSPILFFTDLSIFSNSKTLLSLASLGIFCTGFAYIFYFTLLNVEGSRIAVSTCFLVPALGMILGIIFLKEEISVIRILGCGLIIIGMKFILNISFDNFYKKPKNNFTVLQQ